MQDIYIASTVSLGPLWVKYKEDGWPIVSSWIYKSSAESVDDWSDLWQRCIDESKTAGGLILFTKENAQTLRGALIELGSALASGVPVAIVGSPEIIGSAKNHPGIIGVFSDVESAFSALGAEKVETAG